MANPSGNHQVQTAPVASFLYGNVPGLRHNPGIYRYWSPAEQTILEEELVKYASETNIIRYAKIAPLLNDKTSREVALRVLWMKKNANGKRRKDDHNLTRKSKDKKVKGSDPAAESSQFAAQPIASPYALAMPMMDNDGVISYKAIGGLAGQLLEQNAQALSQISNNLDFGQFQDNISLFCQIRDRVTTIYNDINGMSELMKNMPPLPFTLNDAMLNDAIANSYFQ
ncbi:hypothetical protein SESBI_21979 [Sesbania bispinosa]|nr:hypothetical protein SESBI_21979 [Sesbania bispinosa]